ncbi:phage tail protein [Bradyrhizobium septentrionale]|uniref:Tail fiber protein n=1 Tax=Bradyrhizobium septentrionale TaxID=1404411 RepID=A0ABZ2NZV2_9BRAD|nr:tail fiber protein [Bradyrhizobium septentrionale]UGY26983.1 tail fiber protein [Bradyrhizobium septentrionale]
MGQPYIGEIRMFGGNFAPNGWMFCQGQLLAISENDALFNLIGTTYGGDGQSTFALPNLQGRLPLHQGNSFVMGQSAGVEQVTLTTQQLPIHNHPMSASLNNATGSTVTGNVVGVVGATQIYREAPAASPMASQACSSVGGNQPHDNMQPYLCVSFIISLYGIYPSQN